MKHFVPTTLNSFFFIILNRLMVLKISVLETEKKYLKIALVKSEHKFEIMGNYSAVTCLEFLELLSFCSNRENS